MWHYSFLPKSQTIQCSKKLWISFFSLPSSISTLTSFTVGPQVSGAGAVAYVTVPAFVAVAAVGTGFGAAAPVGLACAGDADACRALQLGETPQVLAPAIHKHVPHATYKAQPQRCCPHLGGQR